MKKIKQLVEQLRSSYTENEEMVIDATIQTHHYFSKVVICVFLVYFLIISITDYALWKTFNRQHLYDFLFIGFAVVDCIIFSKPVIPRKKVVMIGDIAVFIMLLILAVGRSMGSGYVSYTLAACTATATIVLSLNPIYYTLITFIVMLCELCFNYHFIGSDFVVMLYYGVDAFLIFAVASCLNFFFSRLRYTIFKETSALRKENSVDGLTGLYNRKYLEHYFRFHYRDYELSALIHIDLDNFKKVNDTMGHQEGDALLKKVAKIIGDNFRQVDCVSRVGGDEFMVFMPKLSETKDVHNKIQSLLDNFPLMVTGDGETAPIPVMLSIGVVFSKENEANTYTQLYENADTAMYKAKNSGKGRAVIFEDGKEITLCSK